MAGVHFCPSSSSERPDVLQQLPQNASEVSKKNLKQTPSHGFSWFPFGFLSKQHKQNTHNTAKGNRKLIWMEFKIWMELEGVGSFGHSGRVFQLSHLRPVATAAAGSRERCPVPASNKLWIPEQRQRRCGIPELAVLCVLQHGTPHPPAPAKGVSSTVFGFHLGRRFQLWGASRSFSRGCLSESETH